MQLSIRLGDDQLKFLLLATAATFALAGLDLVGAYFAKEWVERRDTTMLVAGMVTFGILFVVYGKALQVADLSAVTFGWFVFLTVGILLLERMRYGVELSAGKWVAIVVVVIAQAYLILGGSNET